MPASESNIVLASCPRIFAQDAQGCRLGSTALPPELQLPLKQIKAWMQMLSHETKSHEVLYQCY